MVQTARLPKTILFVTEVVGGTGTAAEHFRTSGLCLTVQ